MSIPSQIVYPIQLACPSCRDFVFTFTEDHPLPLGEVASCPQCQSPLLRKDLVDAKIVAEYQKR